MTMTQTASSDVARPNERAQLARSGRLVAPTFLGAFPRSRTRSTLTRALLPVMLLSGWWYGSSSGLIPAHILASPGDVVLAFVELEQSGQLREFLLASLSRASIGISLGVSAGLTLGVLSGLSDLGEELVDSTMQMLRAVPFLAVVPLFISWFGIDEMFKGMTIAYATAFPMYAYSYLGVRNVDRKLVEAARGFGVRGVTLVRQVILPSALPSLLMALRICLSLSVVGLIASEAVGTTQGIGYLVLLAKQYYRQDYMVLCLVLYAAMGLAFDFAIRLLERYTMPWRRFSTVRG